MLFGTWDGKGRHHGQGASPATAGILKSLGREASPNARQGGTIFWQELQRPIFPEKTRLFSDCVALAALVCVWLQGRFLASPILALDRMAGN